MNIKQIAWFIACCTNFCFVSSALASQTITVYDPSKLCGEHHKNGKYRLQLAAFHNQNNANQYRNKIATKTTVPIHVMRSRKSNDIYQVIAEPITSTSALKEICSLVSYPTIPRKTAAVSLTPTQKINKPVVLTKPETVAVTSHEWKDMTPSSDFKAGPYVGASLGLQQNITGTPTIYSGLEGTLSLGYGHLWNQRYYLAGEVFGGDSVKLKDYPEISTGNSVRSTWSYGVDVLPGFMINKNALVYARGGVVRSRFNEIDAEKTAWQIGLGGQTNVYKNLDLRAEYIYSLYQNIEGIGKPQINQFNVGLVKKFG